LKCKENVDKKYTLNNKFKKKIKIVLINLPVHAFVAINIGLRIPLRPHKN